MNIDVRSEHDLGCYDQLFDNFVLDTLFGVDRGTGLFLQFCEPDIVLHFRATCFAALLEVRDSLASQATTAHPHRVPDPPIAWFTPPPAEVTGGDNS